MPSPYAAEFTPELNQSYLASLLNRQQQAGASEVGAARAEGESGGLVGQAATGSRIGAAVQNTAQNENDTVAKFGLDVANKQYSERMTDEAQTYQDQERQKTEAFQEQMQSLGFQFADSQRELGRKADNTITAATGLGLAAGIGGKVGSAAAGAALGGGKGSGGGGPPGVWTDYSSPVEELPVGGDS